MRHRPFRQVDVFSGASYRGNPLAVVLDGDGLDAEQMQEFARWTNLSETTFLLPPDSPEADYRVRIFTPLTELAFAGHPTLGSCHAWLAAGGTPRDPDHVVQESAQGLVRVRRDAGLLHFAAPDPVLEPVPEDLQAEVAQALELPEGALLGACWIDNGARWMGLLLRDVETLREARPQSAVLRSLGVKAGMCALHPGRDGEEPVLEVRGITLTQQGIAEDPATGSLNAGLAGWLSREGVLDTPYVAHQGTGIDRAGRLFLTRDAEGRLWVGGAVRDGVAGTVLL
ncbi:phenazine biosynthesis protein PhzF [Arthrobacter woluwensis]|uniref:PhzF family phenazine biosynthesis protein n=1 Tax=Arthrobacter woluwensis TaxID=156980 RepID=UPI000D1288AA|nr:PhzF family phenazine biosynthesis protein [Arthrobacter woluwensis]PSS44861.1 phenazine biosynthesis protein PhzF [Arthrobacter woluwensis]